MNAAASVALPVASPLRESKPWKACIVTTRNATLVAILSISGSIPVARNPMSVAVSPKPTCNHTRCLNSMSWYAAVVTQEQQTDSEHEPQCQPRITHGDGDAVTTHGEQEGHREHDAEAAGGCLDAAA